MYTNNIMPALNLLTPFSCIYSHHIAPQNYMICLCLFDIMIKKTSQRKDFGRWKAKLMKMFMLRPQTTWYNCQKLYLKFEMSWNKDRLWAFCKEIQFRQGQMSNAWTSCRKKIKNEYDYVSLNQSWRNVGLR